MAEATIANIKKLDDMYIQIVNSLLLNITDGTISNFNINSFFRDIAIYTANQECSIKAACEEFSIDQRQVDIHKKGSNILVHELSELYSSVTSDSLKILNLSNFLVYWADIYIFRNNYALTKQISLIEAGISPSKAYEIINFEHTDFTLTRSFNQIITNILSKNESLAIINKRLRTELNNAQNKIKMIEAENLSTLDLSTNLPNRSKALETLESMSNNDVAVLMINIANYKNISNASGSDAANSVVLTIADAIQDLVRNDDMLFSTKKGELMLICPKLNETGAINIANSIISKATKDSEVLKQLQGLEETIINIGIAISNGSSSVENILKLADSNLKKAAKKNESCFII